MKLHKLLSIFLALLLLTGCTTQPPVTEPPVQATAAATTVPTEVPETTEPAPADFYDRVFDTSQDAGKLTARYLGFDIIDRTSSDDAHMGDCAVYTSPDGYTMVVDANAPYCDTDMIRQLHAMNVEKIDIFVFSHPHADHVGSFCAIADEFPIGQVYYNGHNYDTTTFQDCILKMKELDIPYTALEDGDSFPFGEEVTVTVFGPPAGAMEETPPQSIPDANNLSLAIRIVYGQSSFLSCGDLYVVAEEALIERHGDAIRSDVVKMNHHGLDTSNGRSFASTVSPIIAVGMLDSVGSTTVARRYQAAGAQVFYNVCDGAIRVSTPGDGTYDIQTQWLRQLPILPAPSADGHYTAARPQ